MSRHTVLVSYKGVPAQVVLGWDRPLQGFHAGLYYREGFPVVDEGSEDEESEVIWSNLYMPPAQAHPQDLTGFIEALKEFGVVLPESVVRAVLDDKVVNRGNFDMMWTAEGLPHQD